MDSERLVGQTRTQTIVLNNATHGPHEWQFFVMKPRQGLITFDVLLRMVITTLPELFVDRRQPFVGEFLAFEQRAEHVPRIDACVVPVLPGCLNTVITDWC